MPGLKVDGLYLVYIREVCTPEVGRVNVNSGGAGIDGVEVINIAVESSRNTDVQKSVLEPGYQIGAGIFHIGEFAFRLKLFQDWDDLRQDGGGVSVPVPVDESGKPK